MHSTSNSAQRSKKSQAGRCPPITETGERNTRRSVRPSESPTCLIAARREWADLELHRYLADKPTEIVANMIARGINNPLSSSCGRLFDAVAAAIGLCRDRASYEGEAAIELEALVDERVASGPVGDGYPFAVRSGLPQVLDPGPLWRALLADLRAGVPPAVIAARFHWGLADAVAGLAGDLAIARGLRTVALSGGVAQNRIVVERVADQLRRRRLDVLQHRQVPANDGGLSLGQAAVGAMRILMARRSAWNIFIY